MKTDHNWDLKVIDKLRQRRQENEQLIKDLLVFLGGPGVNRRIKPCDTEDPEETDCPAGNAVDDK